MANEAKNFIKGVADSAEGLYGIGEKVAQKGIELDKPATWLPLANDIGDLFKSAKLLYLNAAEGSRQLYEAEGEVKESYKDYFKEEFDLENDKAETLAEKLFDFMVDSADIIEDFQKLAQARKAKQVEGPFDPINKGK